MAQRRVFIGRPPLPCLSPKNSEPAALRAGDVLGHGGEGGEGLALVGEAALDHLDLVPRPAPLAHQRAADRQMRPGRDPVGRIGGEAAAKLGEPPLHRGARSPSAAACSRQAMAWAMSVRERSGGGGDRQRRVQAALRPARSRRASAWISSSSADPLTRPPRRPSVARSRWAAAHRRRSGRPASLGLLRDDVESAILLDRPAHRAAHRVGLPAGGGDHGFETRPARSAQQALQDGQLGRRLGRGCGLRLGRRLRRLRPGSAAGRLVARALALVPPASVVVLAAGAFAVFVVLLMMVLVLALRRTATAAAPTGASPDEDRARKRPPLPSEEKSSGRSDKNTACRIKKETSSPGSAKLATTEGFGGPLVSCRSPQPSA